MKHPAGKSPLDYIFVLRPALMPPVWTVFLLGNGFRATRFPARVDIELALAFGMLTLLFGAVYLFNQVYDIEGDRDNHKLFFLPLGLISVRAARIYYVALNIAALALAGAVSFTLFLLAAMILVLGVAYSAPPWRWKDRAYPALLANAFAHGTLVFLAGWLITGGMPGEGVIRSLPYLFAVGAIYLLTTIPDTPGDQKAGKRTLAVTLGPARTARWALGWYWASVLTAIYNIDLLFLLAALPVAYLFIRASGGAPELAIRAVRWAVGLLSLVACIYYPWYLAVLALGFALTRLYYRRRFELRYP
jgi:chlorophyll synthase